MSSCDATQSRQRHTHSHRKDLTKLYTHCCPVPVRVSDSVLAVPSAFATIKGLKGLKGPKGTDECLGLMIPVGVSIKGPKDIAIKRYYDMIRGDFVMKPPL